MYQELKQFDIFLPSFVCDQKIELHQTFTDCDVSDKETLINSPYYCQVPKKFRDYQRWVHENAYFNNSGCYDHEGLETDADYLHNIELFPFSEFMHEFIFFKFGLNANDDLCIATVYDAKSIFDYWIKKNKTNDFDKYKNLSIGKAIFDLLPNNSSYYDSNKVCGCGIYDCGSNEVLYYKYEDSFSIAFTIFRNYLLIFDVDNWCKLEQYSDEEYSEEYVLSQENPSKYEFLLESKNFKLFEKSLHKLKID